MKRLRTLAPIVVLALTFFGCVDVTGTGPVGVNDVPVLAPVDPSPTGNGAADGNGTSEPYAPPTPDDGGATPQADAGSPTDAAPDAGKGENRNEDPDDDEETDGASSKGGDTREGVLPL